MNIMRTTIVLMFTALTAALSGFAQSNDRVPGPTDYASFSRFITDRNIFDPNRLPHHTTTRTRTYVRPTSHSGPAFSLVGTMAYEKGLFAFFNGNSDELRKDLYVSGKIADFTVEKIDYGRVTLETTNQSEKVELKVGDVMRLENGVWQLTGPGELTAAASGSGNGSGRSSRYDRSNRGSGAETENSSNGNASPPSAAEANDILKRLMEKREQENQ